MQLYDGTRLVGHDSYDQMLSNGQSAEDLAKSRIFRIHPSFRIVALAEPPSRKFEINCENGFPKEIFKTIFSLSLFLPVTTGKNWLTSEVLSLFLFHEVRNLSKAEERHIIHSLVQMQIFLLFFVIIYRAFPHFFSTAKSVHRWKRF